MVDAEHDLAVAEAIADAVTRPTRRCVPIKELAPQDFQALHPVHERLVNARRGAFHIRFGPGVTQLCPQAPALLCIRGQSSAPVRGDNLPTTETVEIISHLDVHLAGCHPTQPRGLNKNPHWAIQTGRRTRIVRGANEGSHPRGSRGFTESVLEVHLKPDSRTHEAQPAGSPLAEAVGF